MTDNGPAGINGSEQYSYQITGQTPNSFDSGSSGNGIKVTDGTWDNVWPGANMSIYYDSIGDDTIYFYPGSFTDGWLPSANRVGFSDPGLSWEVTGDFTSPNWDTDPAAQMTLQAGSDGVYTNIYVIPTAGTHYFKFRTSGTWGEFNIATDFSSNQGSLNNSITTLSDNQAVLFEIDLPNGRLQAVIPGLNPVTNQVVFSVDMSSQIQLGYFTPGSSVFVSGVFNNWPGTGVGALVLTNYPPYNGGNNTNIYYGTNTFIGFPESSSGGYNFTDNDPGLPSGYNGYEQTGNRSFSLLLTNGPLVLATVSFGNYYASDYLAADTAVTFSVDMTNGIDGYVTGTDGHTFDPVYDYVYVNGQFANYNSQPQQWNPWAGGINPVTSQYELVEVGYSSVYTNTFVIPAGTPLAFDYKYGMDTNNYGNCADDEAGFAQNHHRVIRSTAMNPYVLPTDNFGNMYSEPFFTSGSTGGADLSVGSPSGGKIPVMWLGRPGAHLQVNTDLAGGSWQDLAETDGTNWSAGFSSTNGFVSQTNWPASSKAFFRIVRP